MIHPYCAWASKNLRFSWTWQFIYSVSTQQHVLVQWAIIGLARLEDSRQFWIETEISVSYIYLL